MLKPLFEMDVFSRSDLRDSFLFAVAEGVCIAVPYLLFIPLLESLLSGQADVTLIVGLALTNMLVLMLRTWFTRQTMICSGMMTYRGCAVLRETLARHFFRVPLGFFQRYSPGQLSQAINKDIEFIETILSHFFSQFVASVAAYLTMSAGLLAYDWRLGLALLCGLPLALLAQAWFKAKSNRSSKAFLSMLGEANQVMMDWVSGVRDIQLSGRSGAALAVLRHQVNETRDKSLRHEMSIGLAPLFFTVLSEFGFVVFLLLSTYLYFSAQLSLAVFLVFLVASTRLSRTLMQVSFTMAETRFIEQAAVRLSELADSPAMVVEQADAPVNGDVKLTAVGFGYPGCVVPAVSDISFTARQGELTVITGPSGSGKTTLLSLLARFWPQQHGEIRIGNTRLAACSDRSFYGQLALVSQDIFLLDDTVLNNLMLSREGLTREDVIRACQEAGCHEFIGRLPAGYDSHIGEAGGLLSGGERQRLALARALLTDASVLLLDEISAALDIENEAKIMQLLQRLKLSRTLIMIAHRETLVAGADKVVFLQQGKLAAEGTHQVLLAGVPEYQVLWRQG
ncbi:ABC transporter ATP-binding protein [Aliamphritea hakodatensis]|uniref:ABC transporter ATP-binding protein n=1 Tax=Aliamphritea hakodatensis TaxID=2895352 RepID=UPI0022FD466F|nr:ABC transporter ATP-binding protein [Aliamphritea hakodatensis]